MATVTLLKHRPLTRWTGTTALALTLSLTNLSRAEAASFSFTQIADTTTLAPGGTGTFEFFFGVSLNDNGDVAFTGFESDSKDGIYVGDGGSLTTIANTNVSVPGSTDTFVRFFSPSINDSGDVAFTGDDGASNQGIYVEDGNGLTTIADESTPVPDGTGTFEFLSGPSINDSGEVAFRGFDGAFNQGIYVEDGNGLTTIADESTPVPGGTGTFDALSSSSSINNSGEVAFIGIDNALSGGIYVGNGGSLIPIVDGNTSVPDGTGTFTTFGFPAINDSGDVAFVGTDSVDSDGIYVGNGGTITPIIDENTPVPNGIPFTSFRDPSINDNGDVAFTGFAPGQNGIYTTLAGSLAKVVAIGDQVLGREVASFSVTSELNNDQSIAFVANFTDGSEGVFRADLVHDDQPTTVPEPATAVGLLAFGAGAAWRRKQRQGMA